MLLIAYPTQSLFLINIDNISATIITSQGDSYVAATVTETTQVRQSGSHMGT